MAHNSLYEKAYKGDFNQIKVKVDEEISLITVVDLNKRLLVHWAALGGHAELVNYLLDLGSPVDYNDDTNSTPLLLASSAGRVDVVKLLLCRGADVNHKTIRGQTSLHYACSKGHLQVVKLLLGCDALMNQQDVLGAVPLHRAAAQGRNDIVELLLATPGIQVDVCDSTGSTPLHVACEEDREAVACMLVKAGASLSIMNGNKKTALDLANINLRKILSTLLD